MLKKVSKSFEFVILVWWILASEGLFWLLLILTWFDGGRQEKYLSFQEEGTHIIHVYDYTINWDRDKKRYLTVKCKVTLGDKEYTFDAESKDLFREYNEDRIYEAVENKEELRGYLYSSQGRKNIYFSLHGYDKKEFMWNMLKEEFEYPVKQSAKYRLISYGIFGIFAYARLKSPGKRHWRYYQNEDKKQPSGDEYTNRAIKKNPEYSLQPKEIFAQNYPREIVAVAKKLRSGAARVSAQQTAALKKTGEQVQKEEDWTYGRSVMTELSTTSPAEAIYRVYREGHFEEEYEEPEEMEPTERKLEGPITNNYAVAREAVLLKVEHQKPFQKKRKVLLVERTRDGDYALHPIEADFFMTREMPGNYVMLIKDRDVIGVYEDVVKNKENPIMLEYDDRIKKIRSQEKACHLVQYSLLLVSLILLVLASRLTWMWFTPPALGIYMIAVHTYKRFALGVASEYEKKNGKLIFESMFRVRWGIPYTILKVIAVFLLLVKWIDVGEF